MNRYKQRDEVLKAMGYSSYEQYRASSLWARIKRRLFKVCDKCPCGAQATEIHHRTYKRRYLEGRGKIFKYLTPICRRCHYYIEFDGSRKVPLGEANSRLDRIRMEAEARGITMPGKTRLFGRKNRTSGKQATNGSQSGKGPGASSPASK